LARTDAELAVPDRRQRGYAACRIEPHPGQKMTPCMPPENESAAALPESADFLAVQAACDMPDAHPMVLELWHYAQTCRAPGELPTRKLFDPAALAKLLSRLWILDVLHDPFDLRYRLAGTHIVQTIGFDPTGRVFSDIMAERIATNPALMARHRYMADSGTATWRLGPARHWKSMDFKTVENLCVPFAAADGAPTQVAQMVCISVCYRADGSVF